MRERGAWGSRVGFILAAAGSAVGLGNIWKFPYITGVNGGGAFVLIYLGCVLLVGLPIVLAEFRIGAATQRDPIGAIRKLENNPKTPWQIVGVMGVLAAFVIMSFYSVVAGWSVGFFVHSLTGYDQSGAGKLFETLRASSVGQIGWHALFITITGVIVGGGVHKGLERANDFLMPTLIVLLLVLMGYAMTLPGFGQGFDFMFHFDFSKITSDSVLSALGHAFFTLSLGMGAMITYGSYIKPAVPGTKGGGLVSSALWIVFLDTAIALVAGLVIFPVAFSAGLEPGQGPGLIFITLPQAFANLPGGLILSSVFFLLLSFAALTSALSLVEVVVAFLVDEFDMNRRLMAALVSVAIFAVGIPVVLSGGFFDFMDKLASNYLLPLGGMIIALYVGWKMDPKVRKEGFLELPSALYAAWVWILRTVAPALVALVFLSNLL